MTEQIYTDKEILADALTAEKAATNNYNAFANECVHDSVRDAILHCLEQEHCIQEDVFNMMHQRGLYPTPDADANKVENAKQLLQDTDLSVTETAMQSGYQNVSYFIRSFKKAYGISPLKYRNSGILTKI